MDLDLDMDAGDMEHQGQSIEEQMAKAREHHVNTIFNAIVTIQQRPTQGSEWSMLFMQDFIKHRFENISADQNALFVYDAGADIGAQPGERRSPYFQVLFNLVWCTWRLLGSQTRP